MLYKGENAFTIDQLYLLCAKFIKEKEGKAFHLSYQDRLQLSALCKQVAHGPYKPDTSPGVGWLNVVGNDRIATWQALGDLSRDRAQERFVEIIDRACPLLGPYLEAHINEKREVERRQKEEAEAIALEAERLKQRQQQEEEAAERERQQQKLAEEAAAAAEQAKRENARTSSPRLDQVSKAVSVSASKEDASFLSRRHQQESQIRWALNQQTSVQFRQYAAEQHPGDVRKQEELILQLQEQHFHQYMTQVYQQQLRHQEDLQHSRHQQQQQQQPPQDTQTRSLTSETTVVAGSPELAAAALMASGVGATSSSVTNADASKPLLANGSQAGAAAGTALPVVAMAAPSMWTHKKVTVAEFKAGLASDADAKLKIGPGEVVTVRVPTHEEGACIVWEFATDYYDIGFGVNFEWTISPSDRVTVHISESSDEDDDELESEAEGARPRRRKAQDDKAVDEIIPVYRRDCHQEVYCGSHQYPGRGVYLLKLDNSYSLWRSKWLYYRVYYTK